MIALALMHLLLAAVGLTVVVAGVAAVTVPQFAPPRQSPRFRMASVATGGVW